MKSNYNKSFLGSVLAFILGTSCCWLTSLAVWLGGGAFLVYLSGFVIRYNSFIFSLSFLFFILATVQFWKHKQRI